MLDNQNCSSCCINIPEAWCSQRNKRHYWQLVQIHRWFHEHDRALEEPIEMTSTLRCPGNAPQGLFVQWHWDKGCPRRRWARSTVNPIVNRGWHIMVYAYGLPLSHHAPQSVNELRWRHEQKVTNSSWLLGNSRYDNPAATPQTCYIQQWAQCVNIIIK